MVTVASFTDAWIETKEMRHQYRNPRSHLLQMRGLKLADIARANIVDASHLLQMRGLKHTYPCHLP